MDGLHSDSFCLQDLVTSASVNVTLASGLSSIDRGSPVAGSNLRSNNSETDSFLLSSSSQEPSYRFSSIQPFSCPSTHNIPGHFIPQPVQPLPLPYSQVSQIGTSASVPYHNQSQNGYNGSLRSNYPSDVNADYFKSSIPVSSNQSGQCLNKIDDSKRKGEFISHLF